MTKLVSYLIMHLCSQQRCAMRLTSKGRYAVTAMLDVALHTGKGPVPLAEISERQGISLSYLEQLFSRLRKEGLVSSVRGPGGGYFSRQVQSLHAGERSRQLHSLILIRLTCRNDGTEEQSIRSRCVNRCRHGSSNRNEGRADSPTRSDGEHYELQHPAGSPRCPWALD